MSVTRIGICLLLICMFFSYPAVGRDRWTVEQANQWYDQLPWLVGCNFSPSSAINQLEMWQADTFDPITIDRELKWASSIGLNSIRVYLHDIPWREGREGFFSRIDHFLEITHRHKIGVLFVLFDGVWDPDPQVGPQRRPRTGVHNSGWVQSPGRIILSDPAKQDALEGFVRDLIGRYKTDTRVQAWDLFNEPDNGNGNSYGTMELKNKDEVAARLVRKSFQWARAVDPIQPLTVGVWHGAPWDQVSKLSRTQQAALELKRCNFLSRLWKRGFDDQPDSAIAGLSAPANLHLSSWLAETEARSKQSCPFSKRNVWPVFVGDWWMVKLRQNTRGKLGSSRFWASPIHGTTISFALTGHHIRNQRYNSSVG